MDAGKLGRETKSGPGRPQGFSEAPSSTPLDVARLAEEVVIQRVAALVGGLHREEDTAVLGRQSTGGDHASTEPSQGTLGSYISAF